MKITIVVKRGPLLTTKGLSLLKIAEFPLVDNKEPVLPIMDFNLCTMLGSSPLEESVYEATRVVRIKQNHNQDKYCSASQ